MLKIQQAVRYGIFPFFVYAWWEITLWDQASLHYANLSWAHTQHTYTVSHFTHKIMPENYEYLKTPKHGFKSKRLTCLYGQIKRSCNDELQG